jgi:hypothetical protein
MSKLNEAIETLEPLAQAENWQGDRWVGRGDARALVAAALDDMREVDAMMNEIARATSLPATADERAERAVEMAIVEMRGLHTTRWSDYIFELLDGVAPSVPAAEYRQALQGLRDRISARVDGATR